MNLRTDKEALVLGVDTSGTVCDLALMRGGERITARCETMDRKTGSDERLAPMAAALLADADLDVAALDGVVAVTGPGSFTGLRCGCAFVRALALALSLPSFGVSALAAMAAGGFPTSWPDGRIAAILPARRRDPGRTWWVEEFAACSALAPPQELSTSQLSDIVSRSDMIVTDEDSAPAIQLSGIALCISRPSAVSAIEAMRLGLADSPARPVYVRAPDATPVTRQPCTIGV